MKRDRVTMAALFASPLLAAAGAWGGSSVRLEYAVQRIEVVEQDVKAINEHKLPALTGRVIRLETQQRGNDHER